jgi:uncharacterized Zn finger protein
MSFYSWAPYVPAAVRRERAMKSLALLAKKGRVVSPVRLQGHTIVRTFWGKAWCANLEAYSDYENRLPRGRTYVRNGSVLDLRVGAGRIDALVMGSSLYEIRISIAALSPRLWAAIRSECAGEIGSLVELLRGQLSESVMDVVTRKETGLFPAPREIRMECSCPDWAGLCKHLAAVLYGVGARLDHAPEMLFLLRGVDHEELITEAVAAPLAAGTPTSEKALGLDARGLSALFGIEIDEGALPAAATVAARKKPKAMHPARKPKPAPAPARRKPSLRAGESICSKELAAMGVSTATRRNWLMEGVLEPSGIKGVYRAGSDTRTRVIRYLERNRSRGRS